MRALNPLIDAAGRAVVVRAVIANDEGKLRPGLFARVRLTLAERQNALFVPEQAIQPQGDEAFVFQVVDGGDGKTVAKLTPVVLGNRRQGEVEVMRGPGAGDLIVVGRPAQDPRRRARAGACHRRKRRPWPHEQARDRLGLAAAMNLSELCIRRPVFASVLSLVVLLVGLMGYSRLPVREYPNIDEPVVSVTTEYRGASPEIIESQVTQPLEEVLSGIEGVDVIVSQSREGRSQISVRFRIDRDQDSAAADVRDRVSRARRQLPEEVDEPVIAKVEADAQPIIYLALSSDRQSQVEVTDFADRFVKDRLQNLPGVAEVRIFGARMPAMRIWLDRLRLAAYGLTPQDVEAALRRQNVEVPAGRIESQQREFTVLAETDLRTAEQFNDLIISDAGGYLVRLRDIGEAVIGARDERTITRFMGNPAVALGVVKQSTANPLEVSAAVKEALPKITEIMPEGMNIDVGYDSSIFIAKSIENVFETIVEAVVLVVLVIFVFLRSFRATLVPIVTIPVSLIGAFTFMWLFGFSINTLTLLALVLAVGLVVDDAIVMLENISRHVEAGMPPMQAAIRGSREITFAVIAMTITLAAVYAPIGFQTGRTGRLFTEFAWTLAGAVLISGFVALTLSPMMCSRLLRHQERHNFLYRWIEAALNGLTRGYDATLRGALTVKPAVVLGMLLVAAAAVFLFKQLPSELSPIEDRGTIVALGIAPEGSTAAYTDQYVKRMEAIFRETPFVERFFTVIGFSGVTQGINFVRLVDWEQRPVKQQDVTKSPVSQAVRDSGPARLRLQPALARPEPDRQAGAVRAAELAALRGAAGCRRPADRGGPAEPRAAEPRQRPEAQQAAAQGRHRPREGGAAGHRRRIRSAARSRPCWAGAR